MREEELKAFGKTVRMCRTALNITQEELANRCDFHRTYIGQIERGERNPSLLNIKTLCNTMGISLSSFFKKLEEVENI